MAHGKFSVSGSVYRDGGGVVGEEAAVDGRDVALRRRAVLLGLRRREGEEVVAAGADEEEGVGEQLAHRAGAHLGLHLGLGQLEQPHLPLLETASLPRASGFAEGEISGTRQRGSLPRASPRSPRQS